MDKDISKYLIGGIIGVLIGGIVATAISAGDKMEGDDDARDNSKEAMTASSTQTHGMVRSGFQQHAAVTGDYLIKMVKGEDVTAIRAGLDKNTQELADVFAKAYGADKRDSFVMMWNGHIKEYENYTKAATMGDEAARTTAKNNLEKMSGDFEKTMDDLNSQPVDKISDLMSEHVNGTLAIVDAAAAKDDAKVIELMDKGFKQAGVFGDYFFEVVYSEKPDIFK